MKYLRYTFYLLIFFISIVFANSVSAATEFNCLIDTGGAAGTDYLSLSSWESAIQADLTISSTQVFSYLTASGTIADASIVTGATSGTKGTVTHATQSQIMIKDIRTTLTGILTFSKGDASAWAASTAYSSGDYVEPTTANGFTYECTTAGTSDATEPTWDTTDGGTTTDGSVTWTTHDLKKVTGSGTAFSAEISADDYIWLDTDGIWVQVSSVTDDTNLVLTVAYTGTGGSGSGANRKGNFTNGEEVQVDASNYVTISDDGDSVIAVASCEATTGLADTTAVTISGWTTSATNYIKIWTDPSLGNRHNGKWDETKYIIKGINLSDSGVLKVDEEYVHISGLQIEVNNTSGSYAFAILYNIGNSSSNGTIYVSNNIAKATGTLNSDYVGGFWFNGANRKFYTYNNIVYDMTGVSGYGLASETNNGISYYYNNTAFNCDYGFRRQSGTVVAKNNIAQSCTDGYYGTFDTSSDYNISDVDSDAPGSNSKTCTVSFVDSANDDFHLSPSDTSAKDAGTDLSADSNLAFATDIDSETRSGVWDIGADEVFSISFDSTSSSGLESSTSVSLPIELSSPYSSDITVNYTLTGTATGSGIDYTDLDSGSVTIPAGQTTTSIPLTIVDDNIDENNETIIATLSSVSSGLLGSTTTYTYTIFDNDTAGITISPASDLTTTEAGGIDTFTTVLDSQPTSNVSIGISSSDTTEGTVSTSSLVFTSTNWDSAQIVTVTGVDDSLVDGDIAYNIVTVAATSSDSNYQGINPDDVSVANTDNDTAGITVTESSGSNFVTEGGNTDSYTLVLNSQPTYNVIITISPNSQITVSPSSLTFTSSNWNTPQTVTVTAVDDKDIEGAHPGTISHLVTSSDSNYNNYFISDIAVNITDNDFGGGSSPAIIFSSSPIPPAPNPEQGNSEGGFRIRINPSKNKQGNTIDQKTTTNNIIKLKLFAGPDIKMMAITQNNPSFKYVNLIPYQEEVYWDLSTASIFNSQFSISNDQMSEIPHTIYVKFYTKYGYSSKPVSANIILIENSNSSPPAKGEAEGVFNKPFAYNKSRLSSLHQEQSIAKDLKNKLEEHYGKNKIPVARKHWPTIVNSYVYGNYPIKAIIKAIKFGGKTVHPTIPYSAWQRAKDYLDYIGR